MMARNISNRNSGDEDSDPLTMRLRVLGCSGGQVPGCNLSSYLLNDSLLIDAGSTTAALRLDEQEKIENILISHAHLDHCMNLAMLSDNLFDRHPGTIKVWAIPETISALSSSFFNDRIWPDFTRITSPARPTPIIALRELSEEQPTLIGGLKVTAVRVSHSVPGAGFIIESRDKAILYTGDTGPTDRLWEVARPVSSLSAVLAEVSFPNRLEEVARASGHLTPALLAGELVKLGRPAVAVYATHLKPLHRDEIIEELKGVVGYGLTLLNDGDVLDL